VPGILAGSAGGYFGGMGRYLNLPATDRSILPVLDCPGHVHRHQDFGMADDQVTAPLAALLA
jgi:hypothetical protein